MFPIFAKTTKEHRKYKQETNKNCYFIGNVLGNVWKGKRWT